MDIFDTIVELFDIGPSIIEFDRPQMISEKIVTPAEWELAE